MITSSATNFGENGSSHWWQYNLVLIFCETILQYLLKQYKNSLDPVIPLKNGSLYMKNYVHCNNVSISKTLKENKLTLVHQVNKL